MSFKKNALKIIIILFLSFLLFESFLFLFAKIAGGERQTNEDILKDKKNILTMGDSFVYGVHLSQNETFQHFLEKKLKNQLNENIQLVNKGKAGSNTRYIRKNIEKYLKQYNPSLVLIKSGTNNFANLDGLESESFYDRIKLFFLNLRTVRLIKNLFSDSFFSSQKKESPVLDFDYDFISKKDISGVPNPEEILKNYNSADKKTDIINLRHEKYIINEEINNLLNQYNFVQLENELQKLDLKKENEFLLLSLVKTLVFREEEALEILKQSPVKSSKVHLMKNFIKFRKDYDFHKNYKTILEDFQNLEKLDFSLILRTAYLCQFANEIERAEKWFKLGTEMFPDNEFSWLFLGVFYDDIGNIELSLEVLSQGRKKLESPGYLNLVLMELNGVKNNYQNVITHYKRAKEFMPENGDVWLTMYYTLKEFFPDKKEKPYLDKLFEQGIGKNQYLFDERKNYSDSYFNHVLFILQDLELLDEKKLFNRYFKKFYQKFDDLKKGELFLAFDHYLQNFNIEENFKDDLLFINIPENREKLKYLINIIKTKMTQWELDRAFKLTYKLKNHLRKEEKYAVYPLLTQIYFLDFNIKDGIDYLFDYYNAVDKSKQQKIKETLKAYAVSVQRYDIYSQITGVELESPKNFYSRVIDWIEKDIKEIIKLCEKHNTDVIFMNYFEREFPFLKEVALKEGAFFVDIYTMFELYCNENNVDPEIFFLPDRHLNARGNELLADFLFKTVSEELD
ncbi:MAG: hypothetical protein ACQESP_06965 [Candidatus Muiribacteriota bacterium]